MVAARRVTHTRWKYPAPGPCVATHDVDWIKHQADFVPRHIEDAAGDWQPAWMGALVDRERPNIKSDVDVTEVWRAGDLEGLRGFKSLPQTTQFTCGAAAVAGVLRHFGEMADEKMCAQCMGTNPVIGTKPEDMIRYFKHRGLKAWGNTKVPFDIILGRLRAGKVTLVDWNDYGGHWCVVVAYSQTRNAIVLADPARPRSLFAAHSVDQFKAHWHCDSFEGTEEERMRNRLRGLAIFVEQFTASPRTHPGDPGKGWRKNPKKSGGEVRIRVWGENGWRRQGVTNPEVQRPDLASVQYRREAYAERKRE